MKITKEIFGIFENKEVNIYCLVNSSGMAVKITNYGGIVTSISVPDRNKNFDDIVLGFDNLKDYVDNPSPYFGAIIGRCANRIANAQFTIENTEYKLAKNAGDNHLHGGTKGFDKVVWDAKHKISNTGASLVLHHFSPDMDEGYPGNLNISVKYTLTENNELRIEYGATSDQATPVNLTHHSYFNLSGSRSDNILDHLLKIDADRFTETDDAFIPNGTLKNLGGTALDFRNQKSLGQDIQLLTDGYDHNFVLNKLKGFSKVAEIADPESGRQLEVYTTEPGLQLYTANAFTGDVTGKYEKTYNKHAGLCLETQHFPNSPNEIKFPNTILIPGDTYEQKTVYKFGIQ